MASLVRPYSRSRLICHACSQHVVANRHIASSKTTYEDPPVYDCGRNYMHDYQLCAYMRLSIATTDSCNYVIIIIINENLYSAVFTRSTSRALHSNRIIVNQRRIIYGNEKVCLFVCLFIICTEPTLISIQY